MKKQIRIILVIMMFISLININISIVDATQNRTGNFNKNYSLNGNGANDMLSVAVAQLGKSGAQLGYSEQWCADFVSDCAILANQSKAIPAAGYCPTLRQNIINAGGHYVDKNNAQAGDIVFYGTNGASHVEIVYAASNGNISTYGGNSGSEGNLYNRKVKQHPTQTQTIAYIVRPRYSNSIKVNNPIGTVDNIVGDVGSVTVYGWAYDWDNINTSIKVHVYIGGEAGSAGSEGHEIIADCASPDLVANGTSGNHRFAVNIPTSKIGQQKIYLYAINIGSGSNVEIGHGTVNIRPNDPLGCVDNIESTVGGIKVYGWAYDWNKVETSIDIHVYIGGPAGSPKCEGHAITANMASPDLVSNGIPGNHRFTNFIRTSKTGSQPVYLYAINIGSGSNVEIGHATVNIKSAFEILGDPVDVGDNFSASLINIRSKNAILNLDNNLKSSTYKGTNDQIWNFERQNDNGYTIYSISTGKYIYDQNGLGKDQSEIGTSILKNGDTAKWFIYKSSDGYYYLKSKSSGSCVMTVTQTNANEEDKIQLQQLYEGKRQKFMIQKRATRIASLTNCSISVSNIAYTGKEVEPSVTIKDGNKTLVKDTDYVVSYQNNINAGTATAVITGKGNYIGTKNVNFIIHPMASNELNAELSQSQYEYDGKEKNPILKVIDKEGNKLTSKDYDVTVPSGRINVGTYTYTVKFKGNYTGTKSINFKIQPKELKEIKVELSQNEYEYDGKEKNPTLKVIDKEENKLTSKDYDITVPRGRINVGTYTYIVNFKGNYTGTGKASFTIKEVLPTSIELNSISKIIQKGKTYTLTTTVTPTNATDKTVAYTTSNSKVATVTSKGIVKAVNYGTAVITAKTKNGKTATCKVTVPYTVKYNLNGGTNNKVNPTSYYGKTITLQNPTRKGYVFAGWYSDSQYETKVTSFSSGNKTLYAKWNKVGVSKAKTPTLTNTATRKLKVSYAAISGVKGYQIQYGTNSKFIGSKTKYTTLRSYTLTSLTKGKRYYVRVRGYKLDSMGNKAYGSWSSAKNIKISK